MQTNAHTKERRKSVHVSESFQRRYVVMTAGFVGLLTLLLFMDYFDYLRDVIVSNPLRPDLVEIMDKQALMFCMRFVLYLASIGLFMYVLLHRVAGPVIRFRSACRALAEGDLSYRVKLRKHDDLTELEREFNHMAAIFQENARADREAVGKIDHELRDLGKHAGLSNELHKRLADMRAGLMIVLGRSHL